MTVSAVTDATTSAGNTMSIQDFMKVMMTQLTYQDPTKPMDNQEFLAQIAQFTSLEQTQQMNTNIQALVSYQSMQQSVGLIGRTVNVTTGNGPQTGTVASIDFSGSSPQLTITTSSGSLSGIGLNQITSIK